MTTASCGSKMSIKNGMLNRPKPKPVVPRTTAAARATRASGNNVSNVTNSIHNKTRTTASRLVPVSGLANALEFQRVQVIHRRELGEPLLAILALIVAVLRPFGASVRNRLNLHRV